MKTGLIIIYCCLLFSCSDSFINHKLTFESIGDCQNYSETINMISNINGERYEFYACFDEGFDGKNYSIERKTDSIVVSFPKTVSQKKGLYKIILDIDAKPRYHHIILDEKELIIVPSIK